MALLAIHEAGHYVVMRAYGIDASLPTFIPGLGAMIFTRSLQTLSIAQQAVVGIAGPIAGTIGAMACAAYGFSAQSSLWLAAAYSGFLLNAFNLLPVPPLDGSHVVNVVSNRLWTVGILLFGALDWYVPSMRNPFVFVIILLSIPNLINAWKERGQEIRLPEPLQVRAAFCIGYFLVIVIDLADMLVTHVST